MADKRAFKFHNDALAEDTLEVVSFEGVERISRCFRFSLELVSKQVDIEFDPVLSARAWLGIRQPIVLSGGSQGFQTLKIHGVIASFEQYLQGPGWNRYRAVLVPELWRMSLGYQSQIHQTVKTPDMVAKEIEEAAQKYNFPQGIPVEFKAKADDYVEREYVVQYLESDLNFIQRWCEHEGISYYFLQEGGSPEEGEIGKVVFADKNDHFPTIVGQSTIPFVSLGSGDSKVRPWTEPESALAFSLQQKVHPAKVVLKEYNWQTTSVDLRVETEVDSQAAFATFYEYGDHYKNQSEGKKLAEVRAQEIKCRKKIFSGISSAKALRAGYKFTLSKHPRSDFNQEYLLTEVRHYGSQAIEYVGGLSGAPTYYNEFTALQTTTPFRPERITPKPRVHGIYSGKIDGADDGTNHAQLDDQGRYKVKIPFDLSANQSGTASRWIRMGQPFGGKGRGMHAPLPKGTEVGLIHANGDPDRPVIAFCLPNPETPSMVTGANQNQQVIQSGSGNKIVINDGDGAEPQIALSSPTESTFLKIGKTGSGNFAMGTLGHMTGNVGGNSLFDVLGNEARKIIGETDWTHIGNHQTVYAADRREIVLKNSLSQVIGTRVESTKGNVVDIGLDNRVMQTSKSHGVKNKNMGTITTQINLTRAGTHLKEVSPKIEMDASTEIFAHSKDTKAKWTPDGWNLEAPKAEIKIKNLCSIQSTDNNIALNAKGDIVLNANEGIGIQATKDMLIIAKDKLEVKGKPITIKADGTLTLDGGDVKIVPNTAINGELKVKGTNLVVS